MPFYTFLCLDCGRVFTIASNREPAPGESKCPGCGSTKVNIVTPQMFSGGG